MIFTIGLVEQLNNFNHEYSNTLDSLVCLIFDEIGKIFNDFFATFFLSQINLVILIELQRDIAGFVNIVQSGRVIINDLILDFA